MNDIPNDNPLTRVALYQALYPYDLHSNWKNYFILGDSVNHNANESALRLLSVHMYVDVYAMVFMWTLGDDWQCEGSLD